MGGTSSGASAGGAGGGAANGPSATLEAQLIAAATHLEPSQRALVSEISFSFVRLHFFLLNASSK
jgi:hypothetical protein